jgi:hypothetical protein
MSALLETVPGIASVLRSPVADALVNIIRAAAGMVEFRVEDTRELIQFGVRRGLFGPEEGDRLTREMQEATQRGAAKSPPKAVAPKARHAHRPPVRKAAHKAAKRPAVKKPKPSKKRRA